MRKLFCGCGENVEVNRDRLNCILPKERVSECPKQQAKTVFNEECLKGCVD